MKCNEVQDLMELYISQGLNMDDAVTIREHLNQCNSCREYYHKLKEDIEALKAAYEEIELPSELYSIDKLIPKQPKRKTGTLRKIAAILSFIVITAALLNYNTVANTIKKIPYPDWVRNLAGEGIVHSLESGFGQSVELSDSHEGITMTVHNIIISEAGTNVLFSIDGIPDGNRISFESLNIKDGKGKILSDRVNWTSSHDENEGRAYVNYHGSKISNRVNKLSFELKDLKILAPVQKKLNCTLESLDIINPKIPLESNLYKSITIKSARKFTNNIIIEYDIDYPEELKTGFSTPNLYLMDGKNKIQPISTGIRHGYPEGFKTVVETYDIENIDYSNLTAVIDYYKETAKLDSVWKVIFYVDKSTINNSKYVKKINEKMQIDDAQLSIDKIEVTPSSTSVFVTELSSSKNHSAFFNTIKLDYLKLINDGKEHAGYLVNSQNKKGQMVYEYRFNSVYSLKDTKLIIDDALILSDWDERIYLNNIGANMQKLDYNLDGIPFEIAYYKNKGSLIIGISKNDPESKGELNYIEFRNKSGNELSNVYINDIYSYKGQQIIITRENYDEDSIILHIKSYYKNINPNFEIDLSK
jgi:hypothetical protein